MIRSIFISLCFLLLSTRGTPGEPGKATEGPAGPEILTHEIAQKKLQQLELLGEKAKFDGNSVVYGPEAADLIEELKKNPEVSVPLLTESFVGASKKNEFRIICAEALREIGRDLPENVLPALDALISSSESDPAVRIFAAHFALRNKHWKTSKRKAATMKLSQDFLQRGIEKTRVRSLVMRELSGEPQAIDIMLNELNRKSDLSQTLLILGKLKSPLAIAPIQNLLDTPNLQSSFSRTRAILALGEIGGPQAADVLLRQMAKAPSRMDRRMLLLALGLSKDPRATKILLDQIKTNDDIFYPAALQGLRYLANKETLPSLQNELEKNSLPEKRSAIQKTITAINLGGENPDW